MSGERNRENLLKIVSKKSWILRLKTNKLFFGSLLSFPNKHISSFSKFLWLFLIKRIFLFFLFSFFLAWSQLPSTIKSQNPSRKIPHGSSTCHKYNQEIRKKLGPLLFQLNLLGTESAIQTQHKKILNQNSEKWWQLFLFPPQNQSFSQIEFHSENQIPTFYVGHLWKGFVSS